MRILCGTDFSGEAAAAAEVAGALAARLGGPLVLAHAWELPPSALPPPGGTPQAVARTLEALGREKLDALALSVAGSGASGVEVKLLHGEPAAALVEAAREANAGLIVVGARGHRLLDRLLVGSVATRLARESDRPVLLARAGLAGRLRTGDRLRVAVAVDFGVASDAAVAWVRAFRAQVPCDVAFVHVYWPPGEYGRLGLDGPRDLVHPDPEVVEPLERNLLRRLGELPGEGKVSLRVIPSLGRAADVLAGQAAELGADLLVAGTHQRRGLDRLWKGSIAEGVLHAATVPVVLVPAGAAGASERPVPRIERVLAATDLTPAGDRTVPWARALLAPGGTLHLRHVAEGEAPEVRARLDALLPTTPGIASDAAVLEGEPAAALCAEAARLGVDAIVIATTGRPGGSGLGHVARAVIERTRRPVFLVDPSGPMPAC